MRIIKERRSVRSYKEKPVPDHIINEILESAIWAPSAGNLQPWEFIWIRDEETKLRVAQAASQLFISTAPTVIVVAANKMRSGTFYGERGESLYCIQDTAAAIENMLLAVHAHGLGACWIGAFDEGSVARILRMPEMIRPVAIIPIGYPDEEPVPPSRRPLSKVVHLEHYRSDRIL